MASIPRWRVDLVREGTLGVSIRGPKQTLQAIRKLIPKNASREHFVVIPLNARHQVIGGSVITIGTLTASLVHPREVMALVINSLAAAFIIAHNHPSGDPEPSPEDVALTKRLKDCGQLFGITLLDHIVIGSGRRFASLREMGSL